GSTPGGGTTARVAIPPSLYLPGSAPVPSSEQSRTPAGLIRRPAIAPPPPVVVPVIPSVPGKFSWFSAATDQQPVVSPEPVEMVVVAPPVVPVPPSQPVPDGGRGPLNRRVPGAQ